MKENLSSIYTRIYNIIVEDIVTLIKRKEDPTSDLKEVVDRFFESLSVKEKEELLDQAVLSKGVDIVALMQRDERSSQQIESFAAAQNSKPCDYSYYPLIGKNKDMLAVLSASDGSWNGVIDINPWVGASPGD